MGVASKFSYGSRRGRNSVAGGPLPTLNSPKLKALDQAARLSPGPGAAAANGIPRKNQFNQTFAHGLPDFDGLSVATGATDRPRL